VGPGHETARPDPRALRDVPRSFAPWASSWRAILILAIAVFVLRVLYLAFVSPYALVEDEAHYWEWSRRLDWSYYSKGPGVALAIWLSTALFGDTEFAVRLPAVVASLITTIAVAGLGADIARDKRAGFFAACVLLLTPIFQATSILMTIDGPYVACWAVASWCTWRALGERSRAAWLGLGAALAVGFLFKYTILLLPPGLAIFALLAHRRANLRLHPSWRLPALGGVLIALLGLAPVAIWNAQNDWATIRHLLGHLGMPGGDVAPSEGTTLNPLWTLEFIGVQVALLCGTFFLMTFSVIEAILRRRSEPRQWPARFFAICAAAPIMLFYFAVTLVTRAEGNWAMGGYVTLIALSGWGVVDVVDRFRVMQAQWTSLPAPRPRWGIIRRRPELLRHMAWHWTIAAGIIFTLFALRADLINAAARSLGAEADYPVPIGRVMSGPDLAASVARHQQDLRTSTNLEPFVIAQHYGRASLMAFYLPDHPTVYSASSLTGGRKTQYDQWTTEQWGELATDLADLGRLGGRPAVLMGGRIEQWRTAFDRVEELGTLDGDHKRERPAYLGYGYRGFTPSEDKG